MTFREGIVRRGAAGYEELRRRLVRNSLLPARYPEVIVRAQTIDEAVAAVRLARELGLQLATRSGGHSWCAAALRDDSLLLDLSRLNDLRIDPDGRRMTVGPGLTNGGLTRALAGPDSIREHLSERTALFSAQRFHEVAYHHAPEMTFMTFRVSETVRATGEQREQRGVESYTFRDGRLATKDVYRKPIMA